MIGSSIDIRYAIRQTFGLVHAVLLTLITFGLVALVPVFVWSFSILGFLFLPAISAGLTCLGNWCVAYVADGTADGAAILRTAWIPPLGVFCATLFLLPLEMMRASGLGPFNPMVATSIVVNAVVVWVLQVYSTSKRPTVNPGGASSPM